MGTEAVRFLVLWMVGWVNSRQLEGIMMTAHAGWLSAIALGYLVVINAVANGCRLALRDTSDAAAVDWPANLARSIAAAATGTAAQPRKPERKARTRRARLRRTQPKLAAVPAVN